MKPKAKWGYCEVCGQPIKIPGEDAYLCSNIECGEDILIWDKKKKTVLERHKAKGWVKRQDLEKLIKKHKRKLERARKKAESKSKLK